MTVGAKLAAKSLLSRRVATALSILSIALSVALLLTIETLRSSARTSFTATVSQTDLIVGARGGTLQLLLYTVFRIGSATNNIKVESWEHIRALPSVAWTIPYSLGDSHRGYRVVATNEGFYRHYRYRGDRQIHLTHGRVPSAVADVALGSEVADRLGYRLGDRITLSHGIGATSLVAHDENPFVVAGILARTGTPVDRSLYITLQGMEAIHAGWEDGAPPLEGAVTASHEPQTFRIRSITSFLLGARSRSSVLRLQREINQYDAEPLTAVIPGVALAELWSLIGYSEQALLIITACVLVTGVFSMIVALFTTLNERRREIAVLRSLGMSLPKIAALLVVEAQFCTIAGVAVGIGLSFCVLSLSRSFLESQFGILVRFESPSLTTLAYLGVVLIAGAIAGLAPAWRAYRQALNDGLTVRI